MTITRRQSIVASLLLCVLATPALADDPAPCSCPDMLDLANRNRQVKAAIQAYERSLATFQQAGGAPVATEESRRQFQEDTIEPPMIEARDSRANTGSAITGPDCRTVVTAPTACLNVLMEQHEQVHRDACRAHAAQSVGPSDAIIDRFGTLDNYAREEIEGYKAERLYIEAALANLERDCQYTLEFDSTIAGSMETTKSVAKTKVDLQGHFPRGYEPLGLAGSKAARYDTKDVGPPKLMGDRMLMKLAVNCYVASVGSGEVPFEVRGAWMMRETQPPYGPLLVMPIYVGDTRETRYMKGPRGCPHQSEPVSFWSEQFILTKDRTEPVEADSRSGSPGSAAGVIIADWTFSDASGDQAQKAIRVSCPGWGDIQRRAAAYAGLPTETPTCEWTNLKITRKR